MNIIKLLIPVLLIGCAPTTVELIQEAHRTADWSSVEKRLEAESKREERSKPPCASNYIEWCEGHSRETMSCICVARVRW